MSGYDDLFNRAGAQYGINPLVLRALAAQESGFNPAAYNPSTGASGLFQFIPATAGAYGINPNDPVQATDAAARMFSENLQRFGGNEDAAIKAHFAGPDPRLWGPKTAAYLQQVRARIGAPAPSDQSPADQGNGYSPRDLSGLKGQAFLDALFNQDQQPSIPAAPPPPPSLGQKLYEIGRQGVAGAVVDVPRGLGQALKYAGVNNPDVQGMVDAATQRGQQFTPNPAIQGPARYAASGLRGVVGAAPIIAADAGLSGLGPVGVAGAAGLSGAYFGALGAQDTKEAVKAAGGSDAAAANAGALSFGLNALTAGAGGALGGALLRPMLGGAAKGGMEGFTSDLLNKTAGATFAKNALKGTAEASALMGIQGGGQNAIEQAYGVPTGQSDLQAAGEGALQGLAFGAIASPLGIPGARALARQSQRLRDALTDPSTPQPVRQAAMQIVARTAQRQGVAPDEIAQWLTDQTPAPPTEPPPINIITKETVPLQQRIDKNLPPTTDSSARTKQRQEDLEAAFDEPTGRNVSVRNPYVTDDILADLAQQKAGKIPNLVDQIEMPETMGDMFARLTGDYGGQVQAKVAKAAAAQAAPDFFRQADSDNVAPAWVSKVTNQADPAAAIRLAYENAPKVNDLAEQLEALNQWHQALTGRTIDEWNSKNPNPLGFIQAPDEQVRAQIEQVKTGAQRAVLTTPSQLRSIEDAHGPVGLNKTYVYAKPDQSGGPVVGVVLGPKGKAQGALRQRVKEVGVQKALAELNQVGAQDAAQQVPQQTSVQPERPGGDASGQAAEAGSGDSVQREAPVPVAQPEPAASQEVAPAEPTDLKTLATALASKEEPTNAAAPAPAEGMSESRGNTKPPEAAAPPASADELMTKVRAITDARVKAGVMHVLGVSDTGPHPEKPLSIAEGARKAGFGENRGPLTIALRQLGLGSKPDRDNAIFRLHNQGGEAAPIEEALHPEEAEAAQEQGRAIRNTPDTGANTDADKAALIRNAPWFKKIVKLDENDNETIADVKYQDLAVAVVQATKYDHALGNNAELLKEILATAKARMLGPGGKLLEREIQRQFDKLEKDNGEVAVAADEDRNAGAEGLGPDDRAAEERGSAEDQPVGEGSGSEPAEPASATRAAPDTGAAAEAAPRPTVVVKKRRTIEKPDGGKTQFSKNEDADENVHTVKTLRKALTKFIRVDALGRRVKIVGSEKDLEDMRDLVAYYSGDTVAWARDGVAYLVADRIPVGRERGVFLHEVGAHLGLEHILPQNTHAELVEQIFEWAKKEDGSLESEIARRALERVVKAKDEDNANNEAVAYFVEEAVHAGIDPTSSNVRGNLFRWFRTLWASFKAALHRLGVNPDKLNAQDVVDLAYGGARLVVNGKYQGTYAKFRNFSTDYIGTGEGAVVRGWGMYSAQRPEIADWYRNNAVLANGGGRLPIGSADGRISLDRGVAHTLDQEGVLLDNATKLAPDWKAKVERMRSKFAPLIDRYAVLEKRYEEINGRQPEFDRRLDELNALAKTASLDDYLAARKKFFDDYNKWTRESNDTYKAFRQNEEFDRVEPIKEALAWVDEHGLSEVPVAYGYIHHLDTPAPENRLLHMDKPVNQQPAWGRIRENMPSDVLEALEKDGATENNTGDDLERGLSHAEEMNPGLLSKYLSDDAANNTDSRAVAAMFMQNVLGLLGSMHYDSASRNMKLRSLPGGKTGLFAGNRATEPLSVHDTPRQARLAREAARTHNYVMFSRYGMQRVATYPRGLEGMWTSDVQFSKSFREAEARAADSIAQPIRDAVTNQGEKLTGYKAWLSATFQIVQRYGKELPSLVRYDRSQSAMVVDANRIMGLASDTLKKWNSIKDPTRLHSLMRDSTLAQIDPSEQFKGKPEAVAKYGELQRRYNALSPAEQAVYKQARDAGKVLLGEHQKAQQSAILAAYDYAIARAAERGNFERVDKLREAAEKETGGKATENQGPYFPLLRHGDYIAVGESPEFTKLHQDLEAARNGDLGTAESKESLKSLENRYASMKADEKHYEVSAHATPAERDRAMAAMKARGLNVRSKMADQHLRDMSALSVRTMEMLSHLVDAGFDKGTAGDMHDLLTKAYVNSLPENHALSRQLKRQGVAGASLDMKRSFATMFQREAFYTSRMIHRQDMDNALQGMRKESDGSPELTQVFREMEARHSLNFHYDPTPGQNFLASIGYLYHLGVSPAYLAINLSQPFMLAGPLLASQHGLFKSGAALTRAAADAFTILKGGKATKTADEAALLKELEARNILNRGMDADFREALKAYTNTATKTWGKIQQVEAWAMHNVDMANRLTTALATYRLERSRGTAHDVAVQKAADSTLKTQFDYTQEGAPRAFRQGGGVPLAKLIFQFRRYQQGVLHLLGDQAKKAFKGDRQAMATLAYLTLAHAAIGGALGIPFAGTVLGAANLFMDDDDPQGDAQTRLRNYLFDMTGGDKKMADALSEGLPTMLGMNVSQRMGLGDVLTDQHLAPRGFQRAGTGRTASDKVNTTLGAIIGPTASTATRLTNAYLYFKGGDFAKAAEYALPSTVGDLLKAARYGEQGMSDTKGHTLLPPDQFGMGDLMLRAAGFAPNKEQTYYEANSAKMDVENATKSRRDTLVNQWVKTRIAGDDTSGVEDKISEYNDAHSGQGPMGKLTRSELIKALHTFRQNERQRNEAGVGYNPRRERQVRDLTRFAQQ